MSENQKTFSTALAKVNDTYAPLIERQLVGNGINMDEYAKQCVISGLSAINTALETKGIAWNDSQLDQSNVTQILLNVASLKLNAAASPREVYFQVRNTKVKKDGKDVWKKSIEMGIEGDGNDAILARYGRDVKQVRSFWLVREQDKFEYPSYNGLQFEPPKWTPTGKGDVIRVVYPIIKTDDTVEFHIAEREDVIRNLIAHISNNLMNETFGIAKDRYNATPDQKKKINARKQELLNKTEKLGLMGALQDEELQEYISPAWKDPQSREQMVIRKMRNNIVKKLPKDFGNAFVGMQYEETSSEYNKVRKEIAEQANQEIFDMETDGTETPQAQDQSGTESQGESQQEEPESTGPGF
jgi:hypothetical protein